MGRGVDGMAVPHVENYKIGRQMTAFWDLTKNDGTNNLANKLGIVGTDRGVALKNHDVGTRRTIAIDGTNPSERTTSVRDRDPDNHVLRLHTKEGKKGLSVWSHRLISDHENKADKRKHRSTIVVDACPAQNWAWLQDALWLKKLRASVSDEELSFDGAGFLTLLGKGKASFDRAALMWNMSKQGGYLTDGERDGQLWHLIDLSQKNAPTASAACGEVADHQANLRGDHFIKLASDWCQWLITDEVASDFEGDTYGGLVHVRDDDAQGKGSVKPPDEEVREDPTSNQPELPTVDDKKLAVTVWVYIPEMPCC